MILGVDVLVGTRETSEERALGAFPECRVSLARIVVSASCIASMVSTRTKSSSPATGFGVLGVGFSVSPPPSSSPNKGGRSSASVDDIRNSKLLGAYAFFVLPSDDPLADLAVGLTGTVPSSSDSKTRSRSDVLPELERAEPNPVSNIGSTVTFGGAVSVRCSKGGTVPFGPESTARLGRADFGEVGGVIGFDGGWWSNKDFLVEFEEPLTFSG